MLTLVRRTITASLVFAAMACGQDGAESVRPPTQAALVVHSVSPDQGATTGGTMVTVTGTGFVPAMYILFGAAPASNVSVHGSTSLTAIAPALPAGEVDVFVGINGGARVKAPARFRSVSPGPGDCPGCWDY